MWTHRPLLIVLSLALCLSPWGQRPGHAEATDQAAAGANKAADADPAADEAVDLRPKFVAGRNARYRVWTRRNQQISMSLGDSAQTIGRETLIEGEVTWRIEQVADDGSATCTMALDWLTVKQTRDDGAEQFNDSRLASGDNETTHQLMQAMVSAPVHLTMAADGTVTGVSGVEALRQRAPEGLGPDDLDFMESASDLATIPFAPETAVVGEPFDLRFKWQHDLGMPSISAFMHHQGSFSLVSAEQIAGIPVATVQGKASLSLEPDLSKLPANAPPVEIKLLAGQWHSQVIFDLSRHEAVGRNTVQTTQVQITLTVGDRTLTRTIDETIHGQALRIAEQ